LLPSLIILSSSYYYYLHVHFLTFSMQLYKDLHKLDQSRQNRYKVLYGPDSSLSQSPFNQQPVGPSQPSCTSANSGASNGFFNAQQGGGLTSLPASGLSQIHARVPTLVDRNPLATGGEMSIAPTLESYPGDLEDNNLKDVLLGAEMAALKQQVISRCFVSCLYTHLLGT
jgi:hypothetical protein